MSLAQHWESSLKSSAGSSCPQLSREGLGGGRARREAEVVPPGPPGKEPPSGMGYREWGGPEQRLGWIGRWQSLPLFGYKPGCGLEVVLEGGIRAIRLLFANLSVTRMCIAGVWTEPSK